MSVVNKKTILVYIKIFDLISCERFYYDSKISCIKNYLRKFFMIKENIELKYFKKILGDDGSLFDYGIVNNSTIEIYYEPVKVIFLKDSVFHNAFNINVLDLEISKSGLKEFLKLLNVLEYYEIEIKKLNNYELVNNYKNFLEYLTIISENDLNDIVKLVNYIDCEKYKIFIGNILSYMYHLKLIKFENDKILKNITEIDDIIFEESLLFPSHMFNIPQSPIKNSNNK